MKNYIPLYNYSLKIRPKRYTHESAKNLPFIETTIYQAKNRRLIFVAGIHAYRTEKTEMNSFLNFLKNILTKTSPSIILVESPKSFTLKELTKRLDYKLEDEIDYLTKYSLKNNIPISGMDAEFGDIIKICPERHDLDIQKVRVFIEVLKIIAIPGPNNPSKLIGLKGYDSAIDSLVKKVSEPNGPYRFMLDFLNSQKTELTEKSLNKTVKIICQEVIDSYVDGMPIENIVKNAYQLFTPAPFSKLYKINYINALGSSYRNKCMIDNAVRALKYNTSVVAVAGGGHIQTMRAPLAKAIESEFGKVKILKWRTFIKD